MEKQVLKTKILKDLVMNVDPRYSKYKVDRFFYFDVLEELKDDGLIDYTVIDDGSVFVGEPAKIWITSIGEESIR